MTMRDVHIPNPGEKTDVTKLTTEEEALGPKYWEKKEQTARAKREFEDQERQARQARQTETNPPAEAPFQVKGSINLGDFDFQKQQEELRGTISQIQQEAKTKMETLEQSNTHYRDEVTKIQIAMVESTLKVQIENLQRTIVAQNNPGGNMAISERINEIGTIAQLLGYKKPEEAKPEAMVPATVQLQLLKMEMEEKGRVRQFEWDKIESERNWQIAIKKIELEATGRKDELTLEREKRATLISPLESIGAAIARGFADMGNREEASPKVQSKVPKKAKGSYQLQAGESDSGTIECPECQEAIAIAPKSKKAFCPSCEATIDIERMPDKVPQTRGLV